MIEIVAPQRLFSYDAKYVNPATEFRHETDLPPHTEENCIEPPSPPPKHWAPDGLVRVDLMLIGNFALGFWK